MDYIEKVGNIKVFSEKNSENDYTIIFINGSDIVAQEVYFTCFPEKAIEDLFRKAFDIYTIGWIKNHIAIIVFEKISDNTYRMGEKDYFCRIDDTRFFKHYYKSPDQFERDKNGMRIIDR